jgi:hypothetical protein
MSPPLLDGWSTPAAQRSALGDTIGTATPGHVTAVLDSLVDAGIPIDRIALHTHNTYGQALANVYSALQAGVRQFDASAGGIGGCPFARSASGNLATEDLLWMLNGTRHLDRSRHRSRGGHQPVAGRRTRHPASIRHALGCPQPVVPTFTFPTAVGRQKAGNDAAIARGVE